MLPYLDSSLALRVEVDLANRMRGGGDGFSLIVKYLDGINCFYVGRLTP